MFSIHRFDPQAEVTGTPDAPVQSVSSVQDPLARLNARLKAKAKAQAVNIGNEHCAESLDSYTLEQHSQTPVTDSVEKLSTKALDRLSKVEPPTINLTSDANPTEIDDDASIAQSQAQPLTRKHKARIELGLTGANAIPLPSSEAPKEKTASKKKYLKRKKLRAQARKKSAPKSGKSNTRASTESDVEPMEEEDSTLCDTHKSNENFVADDQVALGRSQSVDTSQIGAIDVATIDPSKTSSSDLLEKSARLSKRPKNLERTFEKISKKKRKLESTRETPNPDNPAATINLPEFAIGDQPTQPGALPRFPAPTKPSQPDPQLLARLAMGLTSAPDESSAEDQSFLAVDSEARLDLDSVPLRGRENESDDQVALSKSTIHRLKEIGIKHLLPVQVAVFSAVLGALRKTDSTPASVLYPVHHPPSDICVSAPTGSGKTLSYIVPIVETLSSRTVVRLRALIVLPTRDLVLQVKNTFESFSKGSGLKLAIVTGQHSFSQEQALLSGGITSDVSSECQVDVLIATPGRLIDHLNRTPSFSLAHLCFLVLDEADQLLSKSQAWLYQVLDWKKKSSQICSPIENREFDEPEDLWCKTQKHSTPSLPLLHRFLDVYEVKKIPSGWEPMLQPEDPCQARPFRILLFSATLRRDPTKLAHLSLREPTFIKVQTPSKAVADNFSGYSLPPSLKQHLLVTTTQLKPLVLFHLVKTREIRSALCFCKSVEGATRLANLFELINKGWSTQLSVSVENDGLVKDNPSPGAAALFSSDLKPIDRKKILLDFQAGHVNLLICSDVIARGLDIPSVRHVINYDSPVDAKKYVHRVGRTARAGESGDAWSLVESQEAKYLKTMLKESLGEDCLGKMKKIKFRRSEMEYLIPVYEAALSELGKMFGRPTSMAE